jgi:hypothetical protein
VSSCYGVAVEGDAVQRSLLAACVAVVVTADILALFLLTAPAGQPAITPSAPPPSVSVVAQTPGVKPGVPTGFTPVKGPNGVSTVLPTTWPVHACTIPDCTQADDPTSTRFLRFGASPARDDPLLDAQLAYEKEFSAGRSHFQRIKLEATTNYGAPAVDWEFEYDLNGTRRHVKTLLWRAANQDNFVYASAELPLWPSTRQIYDTMLANSGPGP